MSKICTKCGENKSLEGYYKNRSTKDGHFNICKLCTNTVNRKYEKSDRGKHVRSKTSKTYYRSEQGKKRDKELKTKSINHYLKYRLKNIRSPGRRKKRKVDIDLNYLLNLYHTQSGRCNISKVHMTHALFDLKCVSIDRIDSSKGYIKGNIQLVCRAINLGKQHLPNQAMIEFINEVANNGQDIING